MLVTTYLFNLSILCIARELLPIETVEPTSKTVGDRYVLKGRSFCKFWNLKVKFNPKVLIEILIDGKIQFY